MSGHWFEFSEVTVGCYLHYGLVALFHLLVVGVVYLLVVLVATVLALGFY